MRSAVDRRIDWACRMIEMGACVFPLTHGAKVPVKGGHGFRDAKADADAARAFLSAPDQPNYGVAFPKGSDIIILDVDGGDRAKRPDWQDDWQALCDRLGDPGPTFTVQTPSGGRHVYYRWRHGTIPAGDELLGWTVRKPWKGYVVGPGSEVDGRTYDPLNLLPIADLPEAWTTMAAVKAQPSRIVATKSPYTMTGVAALIAWVVMVLAVALA